MKEPTQEQLKEFWEWCGFGLSCYGMGVAWHIYNKDLYSVVEDDQEPYEALPPIDLNNLFKYTVPKLEECHLITFKQGKYFAIAKLKGRVTDATNDDPALALFWAIYEIIKEGSWKYKNH